MNKYIYLLAVVFGLSGCNDFLELSPTNKVIETDYYKTQEDLTEALVAAYDPLKWNAYNAYSSYERGTNENNNRMIRRQFPKGTDFDKVTAAEVKRVETWLNNYPREILGFMSSAEAFEIAFDRAA